MNMTFLYLLALLPLASRIITLSVRTVHPTRATERLDLWLAPAWTSLYSILFLVAFVFSFLKDNAATLELGSLLGLVSSVLADILPKQN